MRLLLVVACVHGLAHHHSLQAIRRADHVRAMHDLRPFEAAATELYEHSPPLPRAVRVDFAHALLHVFHQFGQGPRDHTWETTVAHFTCDAVNAAEEDLLRACSDHARVECTCSGLSRLVRACHNHVMPWSEDEPLCDDLAADARCNGKHFLSNLCTSSRRKHASRAATRRVPSPKLAMHAHSAAPKHRSWKSHARDHEHKQWHLDAAHKLEAARQTPVPAALLRKPIVDKPPEPGRRVHGPDLPGVTVAGLLRFSDPRLLLQIRQRRGEGVTVCSAHGSIDRIGRAKFANASHVLVPSDREALRMLLDKDGCDVVLTWPATAEVLYLHPCPQEMRVYVSIPAVCRDYEHSAHHGNRDRMLLQSPGRNLMTTSPRDAQLAIDAHTRRTWSERESCRDLHKHSMLGQRPGQHSPSLGERCAPHV
jgi:hypothetical protein